MAFLIYIFIIYTQITLHCKKNEKTALRQQKIESIRLTIKKNFFYKKTSLKFFDIKMTIKKIQFF